MAKKRKKDRTRQDNYQRRFEYSDFVWLVEQFQKQSARNPDLTLEEFAISHGIQPEFLHRFIDLGKNSVTLWHGTTMDRARKIMREGFRRQKKIWFTQDHDIACRVAKVRAKQRGKAPVVFCCEINLYKYANVEKPKPEIYAFNHSIAKDVIQSVSHLEVDEPEHIRPVSDLEDDKTDKQSPQKEDKDEVVDIVITKNAGRLGVLYWINQYLELEGKESVREEHPAVEGIFKWVEAEYAQGRDEPISDEEMLTEVRNQLKQQ